MSDTPRTDKVENDWAESWDHSTGQKEMATIARQLECELNAFHDELSKVMPPDYKDWWQNSKTEWPLVARLTIENLREREQSALEDLGRIERELNEAKEAIDRYEGYHHALEEVIDQKCWPMQMPRFAGDFIERLKSDRDSLRAINAELEEALEGILAAHYPESERKARVALNKSKSCNG